jgi:hypothetical protein
MPGCKIIELSMQAVLNKQMRWPELLKKKVAILAGVVSTASTEK